MATHDYVIANASGAAVRADLNNALAAIVSNNSNASAPATTYAYQWWADTTAGQLKLRNSANDAWITIQELDGTMLMEDGTAGAPGLAFASDLDTGFLRPGANSVAISTNGAQRLVVDASGQVGISETAPGTLVEIGSTAPYVTLKNSTQEDTSGGRESKVIFEGEQSGGEITSLAEIEVSHEGTADDEKGQLILKVNGGAEGASPSEAVRVASSGRLLVGTSTARSDFFNATTNTPRLQMEGADTTGGTMMSLVSNSSGAHAPYLVFGLQKSGSSGGDTVVASGDRLGQISFQGNDGSEFVESASIAVQVDGTPGANDMPGRLVFSTTADGAATPSEAMRIDSSGRLLVGTSSGSSEPIAAFQGRATDASDGAMIALTRTGATPSGTIGIIQFATGSDYAKHYATIIASSEGTVSSSSTSGLLRFNTTSTGATSSSERLRVSNDGKIRIGMGDFSADPSATNAGAQIHNINSGTFMSSAGTVTSAVSHGIFINGNGLVGSITSSGSATAYNTSSDYRLKENVVSITNGITRVKQLSPKRFNFIADADTEVDGFLAHEAQAVVPEAVTGEKDATKEEEYVVKPAVLDDDGEQVTPAVMGTRTVPDHQGIDQSKLIPLLTAALQEAIAKIETLETKVAALEGGAS